MLPNSTMADQYTTTYINRHISTLLNKYIAKHPEGLSRGVDNDLKSLVFREIGVLLNATRVTPVFNVPRVVDHYQYYANEMFVFIYSQGYGYNSTPLEGFEVIFGTPSSWYYPDRCHTTIYRAPMREYTLLVDRGSTLPVLFTQEKADSLSSTMITKNLRKHNFLVEHDKLDPRAIEDYDKFRRVVLTRYRP